MPDLNGSAIVDRDRLVPPDLYYRGRRRACRITDGETYKVFRQAAVERHCLILGAGDSAGRYRVEIGAAAA